MERFIYILYRTLTRALGLLPLRWAFGFGAVLGWLAYWVAIPYRRLALANLAIAFGEEKSAAERRKLARAHFSRLGANLLSSIRVASLTPEEILKLVTVENRELLSSEEAQRRGVVMAIAHMGNWEILAQICPLLFPLKGGTIYQQLGNRFIDADVRAARARQGLRLFERKEGFTGAIALIREGGGVGVLMDQHAGDKGLWCPLFGRLASTTPLVATMAIRSGALLLSGAIITDGPCRWRMVIKPGVDTNEQRDVGQITASINVALEQLIRRSPADWFWVHNRWKTPNPNFLLAQYKRGMVLPKGMQPKQLKPFRIVIRSSNWLGDAVMTLPAVQAIARGRPDAEVTILVRSKLADFWKRVPGVKEIITIEPKESVFSVARKLRGRFDVAVILPNSIRTGLEAWLAGVPRRVGHPGKGRRWLLNQLILPPKKKKNAAPKPAEHQVYHYLAIAKRLGADVSEVSGSTPQKCFSPAPLKANPVRDGVLRIGLCPGAEYGAAKRWLPERFAEVMKSVSAQLECEWHLFGVGGDAPVGEAILAGLDQAGVKVRNRIGQTSLNTLMDELAGCRVLLTNDTGTMHLAAGLGVPTVSIFGSTEPQLTGPLGPGHRVIRHQVECSPCFLRECPLDFRCMHAATSEEAATAVLALVREVQTNGCSA